jgi:hypothetical protein
MPVLSSLVRDYRKLRERRSREAFAANVLATCRFVLLRAYRGSARVANDAV